MSIEVTFLLSYFSVKKSTKSHQRERSPLLYISSRVHESVARAMRGRCVRQGSMAKIGSFALSAISYYHACEHSEMRIYFDSSVYAQTKFTPALHL